MNREFLDNSQITLKINLILLVIAIICAIGEANGVLWLIIPFLGTLILFAIRSLVWLRQLNRFN